MSDGYTPKQLDSGEFYDRLKRRWQPLGWAVAALTLMGSPIYCVGNMASDNKVRFAKIEGRIESLEKGNRRFQRSMDKMSDKIDAILRELRGKK